MGELGHIVKALFLILIALTLFDRAKSGCLHPRRARRGACRTGQMHGSDARARCTGRVRGSDARVGCAVPSRGLVAQLGCASRMHKPTVRTECAGPTIYPRPATGWNKVGCVPPTGANTVGPKQLRRNCAMRRGHRRSKRSRLHLRRCLGVSEGSRSGRRRLASPRGAGATREVTTWARWHGPTGMTRPRQRPRGGCEVVLDRGGGRHGYPPRTTKKLFQFWRFL